MDGNAEDIFSRLVAGRPLDDLGLGSHDGRVDLRGFTVPSSEDWPELNGVTLEGLDFTGADFRNLAFYDVDIRDCVFDKANFADLRAWRTRVRDCSFRRANLNHAVLGPLEEGVVNEYIRVDFSGADLRRISCRYGSFTDVDFSRAKLSGVDFHATTFTRCTFAGRIARVIFWDRPPNDEHHVGNEMADVDFSGAELHWVEFRGLRLDRVTLPHGGGHVVVRNYRCVLEHAIDRLAGVSPYAAVFGHELYWAHPLRSTGIWHRDELGKTEEERESITGLLRRLDQECSPADW